MTDAPQTRPKNIPAIISMVIVARKGMAGGWEAPVGIVISMAHTTPIEQHIAIHKLDHILPCDGRLIDKDKYPELYALMENALPPGSEVRVPDLTHETQNFTREP